MSRIAFISTLGSTSWGGSEELWCQTAAHLAKCGHETAASVHWWSDLPQQLQVLEQAGCKLVRRRERSRLNTVLGQKFAGRHAKWLDQVRPELVVISLDGHGRGLEWMQACRQRSLPYVVVVHAVTEHYWPNDELRPHLAKAYTDARAVYFVSQRNKELVGAQLALPFNEAGIVRNPFGVSYDAAPSWPDDSQKLQLACIGRLDPATKGQDILFDVLRRQKWRDRPLHVTLYGGGQHREVLQALQEMYQIDNVSFGGFVSDIEALWSRHHGLILPSRVEGLPIVIVEAMLCNRMCIVTDVAGNAELLRDGESGFVAAAPKADLLDDALERAWREREAWQNIGKKAGQTVRQEIPREPIQVFAQDILRHLNPQR